MKNLYFCSVTNERVKITELLKFGLVAVRNKQNEVYNVFTTDLTKL